MPMVQHFMNGRVHDATLQIQDSDSLREVETFEDCREYNETECVNSEMESPVAAKQLTRPPLPQRSDRRTSRLLADVMQELLSMNGSQQKDISKPKVMGEKDPHEQYLSSEEEGSFSDDYEDSLLDLDLDALDGPELESTSRVSSRRSQEDTARVVSMTFAKPVIVNITSTSPATSPTKLLMDTPLRNSTPSPQLGSKPTGRRPSPLTLAQNAKHRMSVSSLASSTYTTSSSQNTPTSATLPNRKSSLLANFASIVSGKNATNPDYLTMDPFAAPTPEQTEDISKRHAEKGASAFKKGLTRGLRARKTSMPRLSAASAASEPRAELSQKPESASVGAPKAEPEEETKPVQPQRPVLHKDTIKNAIPAPPAEPVSSPKPKLGNILRRKSIKI